MAIQFLESGGQYHFNVPGGGPGLWGQFIGPQLSSGMAAYNGSTYAYTEGGSGSTVKTPVFANAPQTTLFAGIRFYYIGLGNSITISLLDINLNEQCSVRTNTSNGTLFFSRNGTTIGSASTNVLASGQWLYIEFKAILSTSGTGTCEVRVNGITWITSTGLTNATGTTNAYAIGYSINGTNVGWTDMYVCDTTGTINTGYLGDITVAEIYPNSAGTNSAWTSNPAASFSLTSVANASGGNTVYTGTITGGASNAYQGYYFPITGFTNGANNGTWLCVASTATTITLANASGVAETHAATCAFQAIPQAGIHGGIVDGYATTNNGTRPNGDVAYMSSNTPGQKHDFGHQALTLTGQIAGVCHRYYARKDDAGTRTMCGYCLSGVTESDGATQSLASLYQYYSDYYEADPNTSAAWTLTNFNNALFGVKEIS